MRVAVVGGGFAGLSAAARIAKLRHDVVLVEREERLGGRLRPHRVGDGAWHLTPPTLTLPGTVRDLFRKSGRPLERVLDLEPVAGRRHVFDDKSVLDLPLGHRADQVDAFTTWLGQDPWSPWLDTLADPWDVLRRKTLDVLPRPGALDRKDLRTLGGRTPLAKVAQSISKDPRVRALVVDPARLVGDDPKWAPASEALWHYVERTFGRWRPAEGWESFADALTTRLTERKVDVRTGVTALDLVPSGTGTTVVTDGESLDADVVVWCAGNLPGPPPPLLPRIPASRTLVRLTVDPGLPRDVMTHGNPPLHLWSEDGLHWTIAHLNAEDPLVSLVRVGIDLRKAVEERHDLRPTELVQHGHWGWQWMGRRTRDDRPSRLSPHLYVAGAGAHPGDRVEDIAMATAAIAEQLGPAPR